MRRAVLALLAALAAAAPALADRAGDFDHYVLALSWHPSWCAREGDAEYPQDCRDSPRQGFTVHGLWPQGTDGWPEFCRTDRRDPTRRETAAMADLMGSGGLAWYQWRKHGRCSGLDGTAYLALIREAATRVRVPAGFGRIEQDVRLDPDLVERAFLAANPQLAPKAVIVTCRSGLLHEVRICLDRSLAPHPCTDEARQSCRADRVTVPSLR